MNFVSQSKILACLLCFFGSKADASNVARQFFTEILECGPSGKRLLHTQLRTKGYRPPEVSSFEGEPFVAVMIPRQSVKLDEAGEFYRSRLKPQFQTFRGVEEPDEPAVKKDGHTLIVDSKKNETSSAKP